MRMIKLNDYLYNGDTILKIIKKYSDDLRRSACESGNEIDMAHCNFLLEIEELLTHNEFLTSESQRIRDFYMYMAGIYPFLAFTFKGRIKSLIRAEEKFNGYIVEFVSDYYRKNHAYPAVSELKQAVSMFRDLIAYRIVISMPKCHLREGDRQEEVEEKYLYEIANVLPKFLEERGFTAKLSGAKTTSVSPLLSDEVKPYYRDYVENPKGSGYRSLHITFFDNLARCYAELQLRTKGMDDYAEIGDGNHTVYERRREEERTRRDEIPEGECVYFDDAYARVHDLQELDLSKVDVNMFTAANNHLMNDGCGLARGRLILPFEHLSRFQKEGGE